MAEGTPEIRLTASSPIKRQDSYQYANAFATSARPVTPNSSSGRPASSPDRVDRVTSHNASSATSGSPWVQPAGGAGGQPPEMDPLSQHLMKRTNASMAVPSTNGRPNTPDSSPNKEKARSKEPSPAPPVRPPAPQRTETSDSVRKDLKKGVKAVSFLSKLMGGAKKKDVDDVVAEKASVSDDDRPEGNDAAVFTESVDNMSFNPQHPQPPAYIKVRSRHKQKPDFDRLFLAQELHPNKRRKLDRPTAKLRRKSSAVPESANTVWAMEFSRDGKYLAAAGADMVVRVWAVLSSSDDRQRHETQEANANQANGGSAHSQHLSAPVFQSEPIRTFEGHTQTVLDLSWSKNNFLLSSSMDKTVRLWHMTRPECLCTFKHNDFVPSISFHPKDDRFFLAGSLDSKLRLWSIPDKSVAYIAQVPDMITAVAFTPDGKYAMAGCFNGLVMFYETEGLKYQSQMHVRSTRGSNAKGAKITGIQAVYTASADIKLLVTSNDSRIRLYNFRDKSLELKLKGNENNCSQIRAHLSDCGRYISCGSEDRRAYVWSLYHPEGEKREKRPVEFFEAHDSITTVVCVAPTKTKHLLSRSEDPVFDLCNPPPVTLRSKAERAESFASSRPPSVQATPTDSDAAFRQTQPSPAFLTRSGHKDGNIIVTADFTGKIKVFRQDCAWSKRKREDWDRSSLFTKSGAGRSSRTGSLATKASQRSLRDGRTSTSTQPAGDRIMSWRQGVASTSVLANGVGRSSSKHTSGSVSPSRSLVNRTKGLRERSGSLRSSHAPPESANGGAPLHIDTNGSNGRNASTPTLAKPESGQSSESPTSRLHSQKDDNPLMLQNGQSYLYWYTDQYRERAEKLRQLHMEQSYVGLTPIQSSEPGEGAASASAVPSQEANGHLAVRPMVSSTQRSYVSQLSDERSTEDEEFDDAPEVPVAGRRPGNGGEVEERHGRCTRCGGQSFAGGERAAGGRRVTCGGCGGLRDG